MKHKPKIEPKQLACILPRLRMIEGRLFRSQIRVSETRRRFVWSTRIAYLGRKMQTIIYIVDSLEVHSVANVPLDSNPIFGVDSQVVFNC